MTADAAAVAKAAVGDRPGDVAAAHAQRSGPVNVNDLPTGPTAGIDQARPSRQRGADHPAGPRLKPGSAVCRARANGPGQDPLLKILGGRHRPKDKVLIHGREAFYDTGLTTSGQLSYIARAGARPALADDSKASAATPRVAMRR